MPPSADQAKDSAPGELLAWVWGLWLGMLLSGCLAAAIILIAFMVTSRSIHAFAVLQQLFQTDLSSRGLIYALLSMCGLLGGILSNGLASFMRRRHRARYYMAHSSHYAL